jgi:hypothetical protein
MADTHPPRSTARTQRLDKSLGLLQARYGPRVVQPASRIASTSPPPHVPTGFSALDALTGCGGIPIGALTLFTGETTSGKLTLAYKVLANAQQRQAVSPQRRKRGVAILDLTYTADPDYLERCGVDLHYLLFARAPSPRQAVEALFDLARSDLRLLVVDGLPDLLHDRTAARAFDTALPELKTMLAALPTAIVFLDESRPPWRRWLGYGSSALLHCAALHVELKHEQWLERQRELVGYRAQAHLRKSRWARGGQVAPVEIVFNGTVHARETW